MMDAIESGQCVSSSPCRQSTRVPSSSSRWREKGRDINTTRQQHRPRPIPPRLANNDVTPGLLGRGSEQPASRASSSPGRCTAPAAIRRNRPRPTSTTTRPGAQSPPPTPLVTAHRASLVVAQQHGAAAWSLQTSHSLSTFSSEPPLPSVSPTHDPARPPCLSPQLPSLHRSRCSCRRRAATFTSLVRDRHWKQQQQHQQAGSSDSNTLSVLLPASQSVHRALSRRRLSTKAAGRSSLHQLQKTMRLPPPAPAIAANAACPPWCRR